MEIQSEGGSISVKPVQSCRDLILAEFFEDADVAELNLHSYELERNVRILERPSVTDRADSPGFP
jgi:hypothetical protein